MWREQKKDINGVHDVTCYKFWSNIQELNFDFHFPTEHNVVKLVKLKLKFYSSAKKKLHFGKRTKGTDA